MNKILPAILSCAIFLCSCQPEPKSPAPDTGTDIVSPKDQSSQPDTLETPLPVVQKAKSEAEVEVKVAVEPEPEAEVAVEPEPEPEAQPEEIHADPVEIVPPVEEVPEPQPTKDAPEQGEKVESTDKLPKEKIIAEKPQDQTPLPLDVFYEKYDQILKKYVDKDGNIDYRTLKRKRRDLLLATQQLANLNANTLVSFENENEEKAFWINAHNILTLKLIIDNYPIKKQWWIINFPANSIKQISGGREKMFFPVASFSYTLSEIEQDLLKKFKDPKLCFAFSYASASSPRLRKEVYTGKKLDAQLQDQIAGFFQKSTSFMIDRQKDIVHLSSIFKLSEKVFLNSKYAQIRRYRDKKEDARAYLNFLDSYISVADMKYLQGEEYKVNYMIFDWTLNEKKKI